MANASLAKSGERYRPSVGKYRHGHTRDWRPEESQRSQVVTWIDLNDGAAAISDEMALFLVNATLPHPRETPAAVRSKDRQRAQVAGASAAGIAVLGVACVAGSLFAFGAAIGYGLTVTVGIGLVAVGLIAVLTAVLLGGYTEKHLSGG
jgi:Flp pilus assembly protein TadB